MNGFMEKVSKNLNALRTNKVHGSFLELPKVGQSFCILGDSLTPENNVRIATTSLVKKVTPIMENVFEFETLNSKYRLEIE